jgi:hypothetical protein
MRSLQSKSTEAFMAARLARDDDNDVEEMKHIVIGITFLNAHRESTSNDEKELLICDHISHHLKRCDYLTTKIQKGLMNLNMDIRPKVIYFKQGPSEKAQRCVPNHF